MPIIMNKTGRKLVVEVSNEKFIHLLPRATAVVSEKDLRSGDIASFLSRGDLRILDSPKEEKNRPKGSESFE